MRPSRIRTLQLVAAGALAVLAVRPIGPIERGLDWLVLPARAMGELAGPLGWLQSRPMLASEGEFEGLRAAENAEQARLEAAVLRMAEPESPVLLRALSERSIRGMRAEVVERADGDLDRILIRVEDPSALHEDLPVIVGDVYIGHIDLAGTREDARLPANLFYVHLVTATEFRIGAAVTVDGEHGLRQGAARMVVGGLSALPGTRLEVHNPSVHDLEQGRVVVYEPDHAEGRGDLANGFVLGDLVREEVRPGEHTARLLGLVPRLDYATGLHEVQVLLPSAAPPSESALQVPLEEDGRWAPVRLFLHAETTSGRHGRPMAAGRLDDVLTGAALARGPRFAGRVLHAGVASADVALFGDPGLGVPALAILSGPGGESVHVLGRVTCLGRQGDSVRLRWPARVPLDPEVHGLLGVEARLWTGSGESLVPRGLLLGDAKLPTGPGPHVITVHLPDPVGDAGGLTVRLPEGELR